MRTASNRGLSARTIALGSVAVLAGLAAVNRQRALNAQRRYPPAATSSGARRSTAYDRHRRTGPRGDIASGVGVTLADMEISGLVGRAARRRRVVAFDRPGFEVTASVRAELPGRRRRRRICSPARWSEWE